MKKVTVSQLFLFGLIIFLAAFLPCLSAHARILDFDLIFDGQDNSTMYGWDYTGSNKTVSIQQGTSTAGPSTTNMDVEIYGDSTIHVRKTIWNYTDSGWSGYKFTIEGDKVALGGGSPASNFFTDAEIEGNTIIFSGPDSLQSGQSATFMFDVAVANPEPSTLALLGLGTLILKRPRRK